MKKNRLDKFWEIVEVSKEEKWGFIGSITLLIITIITLLVIAND